jgi:hypothetical protein
MARPKKAATPAGVADTNSEAANGDKPGSQREAVKRALRALGKGASNQEVLDYIEKTFGMSLKRTNVATLKSQIKAEGRRAKGPEGYTMEDLHLVRELVRRIGASRLRDMVDLFDK